MGYKIQYGQTMTKVFIQETKNKDIRMPAMKWIVLTCALFLAIYLGGSGYLDFLIPGNKEATTAAFTSMVEDVQDGKSVKDAFTAFCLEILDDAQKNDEEY